MTEKDCGETWLSIALMHPTGAKAGGIAEAEHFVQSLLAAKCSYLHQCSGAWTDWLMQWRAKGNTHRGPTRQ